MVVQTISRISKIKSYEFNIDINYQYKLVSPIGSFISMGEDYAYGHAGEYIDINFHSEIANFDYSRDKKYLKVEEGEVVISGDVIFKKEKILGAITHEVIAPMDGVVRLDNFDKGIIKIIGEKKKRFLKAPFSGILSHVQTDKHITLEIDALKIECFKMYGLGSIMSGEITIFDDPKKINLSDVKDKIVITTFTLNIINFEKIIALGAKAIITFNFNLESASDINRINKFPCAIINGFGDNNDVIKMPETNYMLMDPHIRCIVFQSKRYFALENIKKLEELTVGDYVKITRVDLWGKYGNVLELNDSTAKIEVLNKSLVIPYKFLIKVK